MEPNAFNSFQIEKVIENIGGEEIAKKILQFPIYTGPIFIKWKEVQIDKFWNNSDIQNILRSFSKIDKVTIQKTKSWFERPNGKLNNGLNIKIKLTCISVSSLGFKKGALYKDICKRALDLGLSLCPPEIGPILRLNYLDQVKNERLRIAMTPLISLSKRNSTFQILSDETNLYLEFSPLRLGEFVFPNTIFIFCLN